MSLNFDSSLYSLKKKDVASLDDDLRKSRMLKYENLVQAVKDWLKIYVSIDDETDLIEQLKSGEILCELINVVESKYGNNNFVKYKKSNIPFVQMENIEIFSRYCMSLGVPQDELFQTVDLFESKDPYQVLITIQSFSRALGRVFKIPKIIGPQISEKKPRPPIPKKPINLKNSSYPGWSTIEYGYMGGANQKTEKVVFGGTRHI
ncbi:hypothetical protein PACTADRAFT_52128 [Pachysolen tannophilus NRRL Y-2460]|uniref:Calponin-homology (CH) domain-containing protein n=1 Tax=Pachysolen tannophilus NRRL Y-2460 TaxID=669874 RepID=A0A1E4TN00_PACTA|nr:hypothetical protein PACTADRAFT_52128 [Pachysolen tannophilus NRRL Y-2460]